MTVVLLVFATWVVLGIVAAIVLGRVPRRADREELGSERAWDIGELTDDAGAKMTAPAIDSASDKGPTGPGSAPATETGR